MTASPAYGLAWQFWRRHRRAWLAVLGYLLLLIGLAHAREARLSALQINFAAMPLGFGLLYLMGIFTYPEADAAGAGSGYPSHLLTLPVRTRSLVLWPALFGAATVGGLWIALAALVLQPRGVAAPVFWPALMLAALLACLQAAFWSPMGLPYLRLAFIVLLLPALIAVGQWGALTGVPEPLLAGFYLGVLAIAVAAALAGLGRARRGEGVTPGIPLRLPRLRLARAPVAVRFRSPARAQLWFDWARNGLSLPLLVGTALVLFTLPAVWVREMVPLSPVVEAPESGAGSIQVNIWVRTLLTAGYPMPVFLIIPPALAWFTRCGLRRGEARRRDLSLHPFLATRPLTTAQFVAPRLAQAALSAAATWLLTLGFLGLWLLLPARDGAREGPLLALLVPYVSESEMLLAAVVLAAFFFWTWRNQVLGLFIDLSGSAALVYGVPLATVAAVAVLPSLVRLEIFDPERLLNWGLALALLAKAGAAAWVFRRLLAGGTMAGRTAAWLLLAWAGAAAGLLAVGAALREPLSFFGPYLGLGPFQLTGTQAAMAAILFLPLARLAAAPLALEWNRRR